MRKLLLTIGVVSLLVGVFGALQAKSGLYTKPNCGKSAVVTCGTFNQSQMNSRADSVSKKLYRHLGVSTNLNAAKKGTLKSNGDIYVGNKKVATGAISYGRGTAKGATTVKISGTTYHKWSAKKAFIGYDTPVHVFFDKYGRFVNAIADVCGNPIIAKPTQPKPSLICDYLKAEPVNGSRTNFRFTAKATAKNGAKIESYTFNFGDGTSKAVKTSKSSASVNHNYKQAGTYHASVKVNSNYKTVSCKVTVKVKPAPAKPVAACEDLTSKKNSRTKFSFTATATAKNGAKIESYIFNFGDGHTKTTTSRSVSHTYAKPGTYTVQVTVKTSIGNKTSSNCKTTVKVEKPPVKKIKVCEIKTGKIITINQDDYDSSKHADVNDKACQPAPEKIKVCELETGKIITINKDQYDSSKHGSVNDEACNPAPVEKIKVCELESGKIITINEDDFDSSIHGDVDDEACQPAPTPEQPEELPHTGIGDFMPFVGLASLVASIGYYTTSRRF